MTTTMTIHPNLAPSHTGGFFLLKLTISFVLKPIPIISISDIGISLEKKIIVFVVY